MKYTGTEACQWADRGKIADWVQGFLRHAEGEYANPNPGFADGLLLEERFYIGPMQLPLSALNTVRVAADITDAREMVEFRRKVDAIRQILPEWDMPPFLVQYRDGALWLTDGNHRYTALMENGKQTGGAIVWGSAGLAVEATEYLNSIHAD